MKQPPTPPDGLTFLVLDVDGVLTDGRIVYGDDRTETKSFHVRDGSGLKYWHQGGGQTALLTGRRSPVVEARAAELGVATVVQGAADKLAGYREILARHRLDPRQVCYVGDDLPDLPVLRHCGWAVAVADACAEVQAESHYVTRAPGGRGAVREVVELILQGQGKWQALVERLRNETLFPSPSSTGGV